MNVIQKIASAFNAYHNCIKANNTEWRDKHRETIDSLCREKLPSGSGFDSGTTFNWDESKENRLVFETGFHHMNDAGYYDGWTYHTVIVRPSLQFGIDLRVTGRDRRQIKDYMHEVFNHALTSEVEESSCTTV